MSNIERPDPVKALIPFRIQPMLATLVDSPFHLPGWVYEEKYDGYRILAYKEGEKVTLLSRNGKDRTESFAEVAKAIATLRDRTLLLDGEVVAFDKKLISRFQLLQQGEVPTVYAVFDCLFRAGSDLRRQELPARRQALEQAIGETARLFPSRRLSDNGLTAYRVARKKGYEGVVAKDSSAPYIEGRSRRWLKVKVHQEEEFVIGGFTAPGGTRAHFGALLVGAHRGRDLIYAGRVGTGFTEKTLAELHAKFRPLVRKESPFANLPREKGATWVAPKLVAQIAFQEWTSDGKLRQPVFLGLRDDKKPSEVVMPESLK
ncbi:MAG TPA: non-homologous end-joining DNA ligase [Thermoanaerobaculia bacterium]|nr:non-homologous end-joining DNA ligase [Thermoanaerobaculia bacterium]